MEWRAADAQQHGQRSDEREREERDVQPERMSVEEEIAEDAERDRSNEKTEPEPFLPPHSADSSISRTYLDAAHA